MAIYLDNKLISVH